MWCNKIVINIAHTLYGGKLYIALFDTFNLYKYDTITYLLWKMPLLSKIMPGVMSTIILPRVEPNFVCILVAGTTKRAMSLSAQRNLNIVEWLPRKRFD